MVSAARWRAACSADEGSVGVASGVGPLLAAACLAASFSRSTWVFQSSSMWSFLSGSVDMVGQKVAVGNDC